MADNRAMLHAVYENQALPHCLQIHRQRHDRRVLDVTVRRHQEIPAALKARNRIRADTAYAHTSAQAFLWLRQHGIMTRPRSRPLKRGSCNER